MSASADDLVARARARISRIGPDELAPLSAAGALIVDIRPAAQRAEEGALPDALVVERNVLEWRLDPSGDYRVPEVTGYEQPVVVVCSEGYASSLAADALRSLGYVHAADLIGGYQAWSNWRRADDGDSAGATGGPAEPGVTSPAS
ncbi:MAG TPA: rhodanese-like domain-containing protein [Acidimicrobiales bacterium]